MGPHVTVQGGLDRERALTDVALEGFFTRVDADVSLQVTGFLERLLAVLAAVSMQVVVAVWIILVL